jgi:hypothetical protein
VSLPTLISFGMIEEDCWLTGESSLFQPGHDSSILIFRPGRGRENLVRPQRRERLNIVVSVVELDILIDPV